MIPPHPERLPDGRLRVPRRAEGPGGVVGDALVVIGPDDPTFAAWDEDLRRRETAQADEDM